MSKVLYVTTVSLTLNTFLFPHIEYLSDIGYSIQTASKIDVKLLNKFEEKGILHNRISFSRNPFSINNIKAIKEIKSLQQKEGFDIIHVHTPIAAFITRLALRNENVRVIYTAHGFHFFKGSSLLSWILYYPLEIIAARWTDQLITINEEDFNIAKGFKLRNSGKVFKIPGVGLKEDSLKVEKAVRNEIRNELKIKEDEFVILILAELNKNKNHIQCLKALKEVRKRYIKVRVLFAGSGPLEEYLKRYVKDNDLEKEVTFLGYRTDVDNLITASDSLALFSKREGLGKALLEGMYHGKILLATNTRGGREVIDNLTNGILVPVNDIDKTVEAIKRVYLDKELQMKAYKASKTKIEKFMLDNVLCKLKDIYEEENKR